MAHVVCANPPDAVRCKARTAPGAHLQSLDLFQPSSLCLALSLIFLFSAPRASLESPLPADRMQAPSSSNPRLTGTLRDPLNHICTYIAWPPLQKENKRGAAQTRAPRSTHSPRSCKRADGIAFIQIQDIHVAVHVLSCFVTDSIAIVPTLAAVSVLPFHPIPQAPWLPWTPGGRPYQ